MLHPYDLSFILAWILDFVSSFFLPVSYRTFKWIMQLGTSHLERGFLWPNSHQEKSLSSDKVLGLKGCCPNTNSHYLYNASSYTDGNPESKYKWHCTGWVLIGILLTIISKISLRPSGLLPALSHWRSRQWLRLSFWEMSRQRYAR